MNGDNDDGSKDESDDGWKVIMIWWFEVHF